MKIAYITKRFNSGSMAIINQANQIIEEYEKQGFIITLRQLYYQFVARDLLSNTMSSYKRLGSIVNDARLAGLIDWDYIQDRTRNLQKRPHWSTPADIISSAATSYGIDLWKEQNSRVEVWIEKDALIGVIEGVCNKWDVPFFSCRGYVSQSEMWKAGQRMQGYCNEGADPVIIHLGDHDPSGVDMSRDIQSRMDMFVGPGLVDVDRVALNMDQILQYGPPPNPAKITDTRAAEYIREHGSESWELDALSPSVLSELVGRTVRQYCNISLWDSCREEQEEDRDLLNLASESWGSVTEFLTGTNSH